MLEHNSDICRRFECTRKCVNHIAVIECADNNILHKFFLLPLWLFYIVFVLFDLFFKSVKHDLTTYSCHSLKVFGFKKSCNLRTHIRIVAIIVHSLIDYCDP